MKRFDHPEDTEAFFVVVCYLLSISFGACILAWQCFKWLKTGIWIPIPVIKAFQLFNIDVSFVYNSQQWIGLAKIAQWCLDLPVAITLPALIVLFAHLLASTAAKQRKRQAL